MGNEDLAFWLSWCIEEYAAEKNMSSSDVAANFEKTGILEYLSENAEILHTQGRDYILGSIDDFLKK
ncbi:MAG: DUF3791 domain-containing protein [Treponema sp.]|nr:DUF3791 domain-containing protein [Treponema sp.]